MTSATVYKFEDFSINVAKRELYRHSNKIKLTDRNFDVLLYLIKSKPNISSMDEIIEAVWQETSVENNSVEKAITTLRSVLGDDIKNPSFIKTIRTKGYLFVGDVEIVEETLAKRSHMQENVSAVVATQKSIPKVVFICASIFLFFVFSLLFLWKGKEIWARYNSDVIFADDFSGKDIDSNRWFVSGKTTTVENGAAKLYVEETDKWARMESTYFTFDPRKPVIIKSRLKISFSQNIKDKVYFEGFFGFILRTSSSDESHYGSLNLNGIRFVNQDYESRFPNGDMEYIKAEGFFLVKDGATPVRKADYRDGLVGSRIDSLWDKWFEQKLIYEPDTGKMSYFIDGNLKSELNAGAFSTDLKENQIKLEMAPEGWWLYHSMEIDYIEVSQ